MKENELDDLFRSNADYLADQPHRDFNPEAFWQQLQPALPVQADRKKKFVWWYLASAASVLLALLIGGIWWMKPAARLAEPRLAQKAVPVPEQKETRREVLVSTGQPGREIESETGTLHKNASTKPTAQEVPVAVPNPISRPIPAGEEEALTVAEVPVEEEPATEKADSSSGTAAAPKPKYRIVHSNELSRQEETETKARAQLVFRIGLPGSGSPSTETRNPLAIPISN